MAQQGPLNPAAPLASQPASAPSLKGTLEVPFFLREAPPLLRLEGFWRQARASGARVLLRIEHHQGERFGWSSGMADPLELWQDAGAMVTVFVPGGQGYAACAGVHEPVLLEALALALSRARCCADSGLFADLSWPLPKALPTDPGAPFASLSAGALPPRAELLERLRLESERAHAQAGVVGSEFKFSVQDSCQDLWLDGQSLGRQAQRFIEPHAQVTVAFDGQAQTRSLAGRYNGFCQQGGAEVLEQAGLSGCGFRLADEARQLAMAPNCPEGRLDLLLMPDQMMLQIHESIGHPLELDRILGDERNFAGTSFVSLDMFGQYQYGSPLLNVSFDPAGHPGELASYARDDEGHAAQACLLIEKGRLIRPLGSAVSAARAGLAGHPVSGLANARAVGWRRPSIDRMANLNIEPGEHSLAQMIAGTEHGIMMRTNVSWSIDDSRNKFQFGCEWGQMIRNGKLAEVVRNPGYRGISAQFWRSLKAVGKADDMAVMGTPFCGKGEPGQVIRVGHASPPCLFDQVEVFGARA